MPIGDSQFRFAEIPEIVFVRGIADRERLGIFHIDTGNRWTPGDLDNSSGWKPRVPTELDIQDGRLSGVRYDSATADAAYDGSGNGNETAVVQLDAPSLGVASARFRIRVLEPTIAWGVGAATRFPDIGLDSGQVPWKEMQRSLQERRHRQPPERAVRHGRALPGRLLHRPWQEQPVHPRRSRSRGPSWSAAASTSTTSRPATSRTSSSSTRSSMASKFPTDRPVNVYITQVYQHDSTRDQNGIGAPDYEGDSKYGIVKAPNTQTHWIWNFHGSQMGSPSNLRHQVYMHGRPDGYLNVNNIRVDGARGCSILKSTKYYNTVRNSRLSALVDPAQPAMGLRADKLIDIASAGETVIYNNELIGAFTQATKGTQSGLDQPARASRLVGLGHARLPRRELDPPTTSITGGGYLAPEGLHGRSRDVRQRGVLECGAQPRAHGSAEPVHVQEVHRVQLVSLDRRRRRSALAAGRRWHRAAQRQVDGLGRRELGQRAARTGSNAA